MRTMLVALFVLAGVPLAVAQEAIPRDEALKAAFQLCRDLPKMLETPIPTDPDVKRPVGIHAQQRGLLVFPESKLAVDCLARASLQPAAIGQMWMLKIVPVVGGNPAKADQLHMVEAHTEKVESAVALCALGVRKGADGQPELLIFGKGQEPLAVAKMTTISEKQENPIEVSAEPQGDGALVTLKILGAYTASFPAAMAE